MLFFVNGRIRCHVLIILFLMKEGDLFNGPSAYYDLKNLIINETDRQLPKKPVVPAGISPTAVRQCGAHAHWNPICGAWPSLCKEESCFVYLDRVSQPGQLDCIGWTCDPGCICDNGPEVAWVVYKATYNKAYPTEMESRERKDAFMYNLYLVTRDNAKPSEKRYGLGNDADTASITSMRPPPTALPILDPPKQYRYPGGRYNPFNWFG